MTDFFSLPDHDRYRDVKWAHILGDMERYRAISDNIGQYRAISGDIGVISSSVKSVMYLARPIQVVPGQLIF
mgnify:CR=1 FL=1